jgi:molecular chaperone DnaK (HSP70)
MPPPTTLISDIPKDKRGIGVGIDLGTTNSAISILNEEGIPYLIKIDGKSTIASVVTLQADTMNQDDEDHYNNDNDDDDNDTRTDPNHKETKSYQILVGEVLSNERKQDYQHDCFTYRHVKRVIGMGTEVGECI